MAKYWISYSGGISSAVSCILADDLELDYEIIFADTTVEDVDLYRFNNDLCKTLSKDMITVTTGMNPWDSFVKHRWIGNTRTAHCSSDLKTDPIRKFMDKFAGPDDILVLGMNWDEIDRVERAQKNWGGCGCFTDEDTTDG